MEDDVNSDIHPYDKEPSLFDVVSLYTKLKRSGPQFKGISPFTLEKSPSFFVHPTKLGGSWKCFSTGEGGVGVYSFMAAIHRRHNFGEAFEIKVEADGYGGLSVDCLVVELNQETTYYEW